MHRLTYGERAKLAKCGLAAQCLELMERKKTNLSVAADVDTAEEMLALADKVRVGGSMGGCRGRGRRVLSLSESLRLINLHLLKSAPTSVQLHPCPLRSPLLRSAPTFVCSRPTSTSLTSGMTPSSPASRTWLRNTVSAGDQCRGLGEVR